DGIVFVADSDPGREFANQYSLLTLQENLKRQGKRLADLPLVFQWNKRDVANPIPVSALQSSLNPTGAPSIEAIASRGVGVWQTKRLILQQTLLHLRAQQQRQRPVYPTARREVG
ncbi:MAG: GTPase domain-containing protein, partial [Myxococcota bacterium]